LKIQQKNSAIKGTTLKVPCWNFNLWCLLFVRLSKCQAVFTKDYL